MMPTMALLMVRVDQAGGLPPTFNDIDKPGHTGSGDLLS
jgi:hypothetical protein